jgi:hypothetical protein
MNEVHGTGLWKEFLTGFMDRVNVRGSWKGFMENVNGRGSGKEFL